MKKIYVFLLYHVVIIFFLSEQVYSQNTFCEWEVIIPSVSYNQCNSNPWILVFEDDFNGNELDYTKWKLPFQGVLRDFNFENSKHWYTNRGDRPSLPITNNIVVDDGKLNIITRREEPPIHGTFNTKWGANPEIKTSDFNFSSGEIESQWEFSFGRFEASIKIPKGRGFWPAFWTFGKNPCWEEIDIFEFWNEYKLVIIPYPHYQINYDKLSKVQVMTVHKDNECNDTASQCGGAYEGADFSQEPHKFGLNWEPNKIEWRTDDNLKRTDLRLITYQNQNPGCNIDGWVQYKRNKIFPVNPMSIILGIAIQYGTHDGVNKEPDAFTIFPDSMEIDWIRYYQRHEHRNVIITNPVQFVLVSKLYNVLAGIDVEMDCTYEIEDEFFLKIMSETKILLKPGFVAKNGSSFIATINPSMFSTKSSYNKSITSTNIDYSLNDNFSGNEVKEDMKSSSKFVKMGDIRVGPNPNKGRINFNFGSLNQQFYKIELFTIYGNKIELRTQSSNNSHTSIDVTSISKGMYVLQITNTQTSNTITKKILIQ